MNPRPNETRPGSGALRANGRSRSDAAARPGLSCGPKDAPQRGRKTLQHLRNKRLLHGPTPGIGHPPTHNTYRICRPDRIAVPVTIVTGTVVRCVADLRVGGPVIVSHLCRWGRAASETWVT